MSNHPSQKMRWMISKTTPIKRKMYKVGYDLTGKTTRTLDGNTSNGANRLYEIFGV